MIPPPKPRVKAVTEASFFIELIQRSNRSIETVKALWRKEAARARGGGQGSTRPPATSPAGVTLDSLHNSPSFSPYTEVGQTTHRTSITRRTNPVLTPWKTIPFVTLLVTNIKSTTDNRGAWSAGEKQLCHYICTARR